jgi:hypothetical protein
MESGKTMVSEVARERILLSILDRELKNIRFKIVVQLFKQMYFRSELIKSLRRELIVEIDHQAPNPFNITATDEENEFEPEENHDLSR